MDNYCIDCHAIIDQRKRSVRCKSCANIGKRNPNYGHSVCGKEASNYKHGKYCGETFCKQCGKQISLSATYCRSCSNLGERNPFYGHHHTKDVVQKIRLNSLGKKRPKISIFFKSLWKDSEFRNKTIKKSLLHGSRSPNKPEQMLQELLKKFFGSSYSFVGDGKVVLNGFCPDFISNGNEKKIIELYGDYWHKRPDLQQRDKRRIKTYKKLGYTPLIVWQKELKDVTSLKKKLYKFHTLDGKI